MENPNHPLRRINSTPPPPPVKNDSATAKQGKKRQCKDCKLWKEQGVYWHSYHQSWSLRYGVCSHWLARYEEDAKRLGLSIFDDLPNRAARRVEWENCDNCQFFIPNQ